jgi:glycosyltransferase involved in cell wall biosynthesis
MSKPLLSICIPTYNRAEYLKKSIESIVCQDEFKTKHVEIVISDNASTDNTGDVVKEYTNKYDNIYYYRNKENIRNDNFPLVLSKGNGMLRRLCNDTLCFESGSLKYVCNIVRKYAQMRPFICWLGAKGRPDIEELNFRDGIRVSSYWITSIACFSIWENECVNIEKDTDGAELLLWQVRKTLELASEKNRMVLINKPLTSVQAVYKKNISYGLYHVFYENYFMLLTPYFENGKLTEDDKEYLEKDLLLNFFSEWCAKWKLQNTTLQYSKTEDLCERVYQQFHNKSYWNEYTKKFNKFYWKLKIKGTIKSLLGRG